MTQGVELQTLFEADGEKTKFTFSVIHPTAEYCKQQEEMGFYNGWGSAIKRIETLLETCSIIPAMNQIESHPFLQQDELISFCQDKWINITAYAPLGSMDRPPQLKVANEPILLEHPVILEIAKKHNTTPAGVLIGWAIWRNTIVIPKSTSVHRIEENLKSAEVVLDKKDYEEISKLNLGFRFYTGVLFPTAWTDYTQEYLWG